MECQEGCQLAHVRADPCSSLPACVLPAAAAGRGVREKDPVRSAAELILPAELPAAGLFSSEVAGGEPPGGW